MYSIKAMALIALAVAGAAEAADLRVEVLAVPNASGKVYAAAFNNAEDFPKAGRSIAATYVQANPGTVTLEFTGLAPGTYAISVFHDQNGNERLDTNSTGTPVEPYGFSRDARGIMGPPKFADSAIALAPGGSASIRINLR